MNYVSVWRGGNTRADILYRERVKHFLLHYLLHTKSRYTVDFWKAVKKMVGRKRGGGGSSNNNPTRDDCSIPYKKWISVYPPPSSCCFDLASVRRNLYRANMTSSGSWNIIPYVISKRTILPIRLLWSYVYRTITPTQANNIT